LSGTEYEREAAISAGELSSEVSAARTRPATLMDSMRAGTKFCGIEVSYISKEDFRENEIFGKSPNKGRDGSIVIRTSSYQ
jgi:hypothetical protein